MKDALEVGMGNEDLCQKFFSGICERRGEKKCSKLVLNSEQTELVLNVNEFSMSKHGLKDASTFSVIYLSLFTALIPSELL